MLIYILRRILWMIPMLIGVSLIVFFFMSLAPGDFLDEARYSPEYTDEYVEIMERRYGLVDAEGNKTPWYVQYAYWLNTVSPIPFIDTESKISPDERLRRLNLRIKSIEENQASIESSESNEGKENAALLNKLKERKTSLEKSINDGSAYTDTHTSTTDEDDSYSFTMGYSLAYKMPVIDLLMQRLPATFLLSLTSSTLFVWLIAIPLGVFAAMKKDGICDRITALFAYAALSIPEFFLALIAVVFAALTGLFPTGGFSSIDSDFLSPGARILDHAHHLILPTIVLGIGGIAGMMRVMRANFIDYMHAEFVNTGRAKGLSERVIMFKHVLRNKNQSTHY